MSYWLIIIWTVFFAIFAFFKLKYTYWENRGVKQLEINPLWGNIPKLTTMHHSQLLQELYETFKGKAKLAGTYIYTKPIAVILDLDLVKTVLIKDFNKFVDRFEFHNPKDILAQHLFSADGEIWRSLRTKLTPTFTSGKMKYMFPTMVQVAQEFAKAFERELSNSATNSVEMHDMNARFTTDVIGTCVFGVQCNSLRDSNVEFRQVGRRIFGRNDFSIRYRLFTLFYGKILKIVGLKRFPIDMEKFFVRIVRDTVLERERLNIKRNDFIDLLIDLKNKKDTNGKPLLSLDLVAAQLFVFFAAGFETSSSNMSYGLYEMAKNPDKQEKLRNEILETLKKHNNELTYEAMMEMSYLDQVISETLRLYPALAFLQRICKEDYLVPDTDIVLEKGTWVYIPAKAIHYDPDIYENPLEFQPERFHPSEVQSRHPQSFLGFGDGPRNCIGLRFGRMQVRIGLITLLSKYRFSLSEKTPEKLEISKHSFVMIPAKGKMSFWLIIIWTALSTLLGYLRVKYNYWVMNGVKQLKPHFLFGHFFKLKSLHHTEIMQEVYDNFKGKVKLAGIYFYTKPIAVILDLDVVKAILIKDFHNFEDRMEYKNTKDILSTHLFNVERTVWKPLRQKLTPTFTSGKMKFMFPTINKLTQELREAYERNIEEFGDMGVNMYDLNARYTTDVVGTCIFGIECNSLKDPSVEFRQICSKVFGRTNFNVRWHMFKLTYAKLMQFLGSKRYPQFIEDFFMRVARDSVIEREKQGIKRNDFLNILIDLKNTKDENGEAMLTYDQIAAQLFVFFVAGFETSSTNMSYVLYELARHPEIQERVRKEVLHVLEKYDGELTYEAMMEMTYLDQVILETLRLYPALSYIQRVSLNDYKIPDTNITLDKGTNVYIPVKAIHLDAEIYENPLEFQPERFSPSQTAARHSQSFLGFGDGPRNCIGLRFGRMQNRIGLVTLLKIFKFSPCSRTCERIKFSNHSMVNIPLNGIYLKVENHKLSYWHYLGVKQLKTKFLLGHFLKLKSLHHTELMQEVYDSFKGKAKIAGIYIYTKPIAVIIDLDVVKAILIKDFHNFEDRMEYKNSKDILSTHLFNVERRVWKPLRQKVSPIFTTGKMKFMFPTINQLTHQLKETYEVNINDFAEQGFDIYDLSARFTIDVVGTCIFGIECNSLKDPKVEFKQVCSKVFGRTNFNIRWHLFKLTYAKFMQFTRSKRYPQYIEDFFMRVARDAVIEREKEGIKRNDFMNTLIDLKNTKDEFGEPMLTYNQIAAQLFVFFLAGYETASTNMTFMLYELARHPEIQEKVRQEVLNILNKYNGELSYEAMMEMTYLDQIITETLRLYPNLSFLQRVSLNDYKITGTDIILPKGTNIYIPAKAIHLDPDIYENPMAFQPERFAPSQIIARHPQSFLGFGDGPRNCIGSRFGRMQNRIGLVTLLRNFKFSPCSRTCESIKFSDHSFINVPLNGIYLKVEKL
ncbi:Cytochrome P450 6a2 [Lucilia cuprina]|uniref:Cytochrome P450 6a2 n=1 Tax=Lucilia cuprina TaxID=7375 RepID=A0A0L0BX26_LUCCU|nr:Cytochrome P450 6a2 [Lucilia cuprina]